MRSLEWLEWPPVEVTLTGTLTGGGRGWAPGRVGAMIGTVGGR